MVPEGLRTISAFLLLHDQVLGPLLASAHSKPEPLVEAETTLLDRLHQQLRGTMQEVLLPSGPCRLDRQNLGDSRMLSA
jgi:hypothetical protein